MAVSAEERAWRADLATVERDYLLSDALFRLHRDFFELESVARRASRDQIRAIRLMVNGRFATAVAGAIGLAAFLRSFGNMTWTSVPVLIACAIVIGLLLLWLWQIKAAGDMEVGLAALERGADSESLEDREDYVFEEVNAYSVRHKVLQSIIAVMKEAPIESLSTEERDRTTYKLKRYEEIAQDCRSRVKHLTDASAALVARGLRSSEDHQTLEDWAAATKGP